MSNPNFQNFISLLKNRNFETEREREIEREIGLLAVQTHVDAAETVRERESESKGADVRVARVSSGALPYTWSPLRTKPNILIRQHYFTVALSLCSNGSQY